VLKMEWEDESGQMQTLVLHPGDVVENPAGNIGPSPSRTCGCWKSARPNWTTWSGSRTITTDENSNRYTYVFTDRNEGDGGGFRNRILHVCNPFCRKPPPSPSHPVNGSSKY
jgi:hypothetical protein